ncbi:MAG: SH3 domain-containing protein, partial [Myxococcota bacterium]|nr:SH3 domain-containing protein [Myxococcota bacterium]
LVSPSAPHEIFAPAGGRAQRGHDGGPVALYERLRDEQGVRDPVVEHNLGNGYFRQGAYGRAILSYRRGLLSQPEADVARSLESNLQVSRRVLQQRYRTTGQTSQFIYDEPASLAYRVSHAVSRWTLEGVFLSAWGLLASLLVWRRMRPLRRGLSVAAVPAALVALLVGVTLVTHHLSDQGRRIGVVVVDKSSLREGPHAEARGVRLPEGMEVRVVDKVDAWVRVELSNGRQGWVRDGEVGVL